VRRTLRPRHSPAVRRAAQAAALILLALAALMAVPQIRAAVAQVLHIGSVTIFTFTTPTATPTPLPTLMATRPPPQRSTPIFPTSAGPQTISSVLDLPGETTLAEAQAASQMSISLPTYPPVLGSPDRVFLQHIGGPIVTLVWMQPDDPTRVWLAIQALDNTIVASKYDSLDGQSVTVNGRTAYWLTDSHELTYWDGSGGYFSRQVNANVLIWTLGRLTYRLESHLSLEEALHVAESVR